MPKNHSSNLRRWLIAAVVIGAAFWAVFAYRITPDLIADSYLGKSLPIFNHMIKRQATLPVDYYLAKWSHLANTTSLCLALLGAFLFTAVGLAIRELPSTLSFRGHVRELDGLRALAVTLVLLNHFGPLYDYGTAITNLECVGWMGVDLFFVLSGFLITGILMDARHEQNFYRTFYVRRTLRIFPLYYVSMIVAFVVYMLYSANRYHYAAISARFFFYVGNLWLSTGYFPAILIPLWSLQVEEQFYLVFPYLIRKLEPARLFQILLWIVVLSGPARLASYFLLPRPHELQYFLTPFRLDAIALGALIAIRARRGPWNIRPWVITTLMIGLIVAMFAYLSWGLFIWQLTARICTFGFSIVDLAVASVVLWALRFRDSWPAGWLRNKVLQYVGKVSYGVYILQYPTYVLLRKLDPRWKWHIFSSSDVNTWKTNGWVGFFVFCTIVVIIASVSFYVLENPFLRLKDRLTSTKSKGDSNVRTPALQQLM
jgi:peptidoglycan/LPS O-acetylase OafA/YrhL